MRLFSPVSVFITASALSECGKGYGVCLKNRSGYDCFIALQHCSKSAVSHSDPKHGW